MKHPLAHKPPRRPWKRHAAALALAWLVATVWGSVVQTQFNLQALTALGVDVPAADRLLTTWHDLLGFGPVYAGILAAGWLPALTAALLIARSFPSARSALLTAAAGLGLVVAVRVVDAVAPMPAFIDATRSWTGLLAMAAGSAVAGWIYARLTNPKVE